MLTDSRLYNCPVHYLWPQEDVSMRVPDSVLKSVVFIGIREGTEPVYRGTAFLVGLQTPKNSIFLHLVTAKHIAEKLDGADYVIRANARSGPPIVFEGMGTKWWYHPTEAESVDIAVTPFAPHLDISQQLDTSHIPLSSAATDDAIDKHKIGVGDQVFMTGLFSRIRSMSRNMPIVRMGNVALITDEKIPFGKHGALYAHLIEARSIGGLSGSPAFVRETLNIPVSSKPVGFSGVADNHLHGAGRFYFLGSTIGHWELNPLNNPVQDEMVNMGIALVVPAKRIIEALNHPELVQMRETLEKQRLEESSDGAKLDSDIPERSVFTKEDFDGALKKASRKTGTK